jgi:recombination protein RecA
MAPATARAALEALLRDRKLDNTLTAALPLTSSEYADRVVASGIPHLDDALGGGLPRGQISEIVGAASSGRTSLLMACLADATARSELVALIDALDRFDPASAAAAGVRLDRLLWIRGDAVPDEQPVIETAWHPARPQPGRRRMTPMDRAVGRALKALNLMLSAGGFGVVALDVGEVPAHALRALPFTTWLRLQRVIAASDTVCVLLADAPLARSAGGTSMRLAPRAPMPAATFHDRVLASRHPFIGTLGHAPTPDASRRRAHLSAAVWVGESGPARRLRGLAVQAQIQAGLRSTSCAVDFAR